MQHLNYNGDVTHMIGEKIVAPFLAKDWNNDRPRTWVVTDGIYDAETNKTRLELDEVT